ncbi:hypothetical protein ACGFZQ_13170 [Streptomyces sp. NPDC048254]|uniref:scabin-related ADP-ribosyltransferase n=1 Tax=Streptomyces sp. NPDC048254 TaxID=3365525 RepID=UPI00371E5B1B
MEFQFQGPRGVLRVLAPGGLYGMLPLEKEPDAGGRYAVADGLEALLPDVFGEPAPATSRPDGPGAEPTPTPASATDAGRAPEPTRDAPAAPSQESGTADPRSAGEPVIHTVPGAVDEVRASVDVPAVDLVEGPMPNAAVAAHAADIIPPPLLSPGRHFFVADDGRPAAVLAEGLVPAGTGLDLVAYAQMGDRDSAGHGFVVAGTSREAAAQRLGAGHVWEVDAPAGIDVAGTLGAFGISYPAAGAPEVAFAGGIASRYLKGAWTIVPGTGDEENTLGEWLPNPHYRPYDDGSDVTHAPALPAGPTLRLPIEPVLDKRVFRVEDAVSAAELRDLHESLAAGDTATGEQAAPALGARLTEHIRVELARQALAVGHVDLHLTMQDGASSLAGMALARVVANTLNRRAMLTIGTLHQPFDICPSTRGGGTET